MNKKMIPLLLLALLPIVVGASRAKARYVNLAVSYEKAVHPLFQGIADLIVEEYDQNGDQLLDPSELKITIKNLQQLRLLPPPPLMMPGKQRLESDFAPPPLDEVASRMMTDLDESGDHLISAKELIQLFQRRQQMPSPQRGKGNSVTPKSNEARGQS